MTICYKICPKNKGKKKKKEERNKSLSSRVTIKYLNLSSPWDDRQNFARVETAHVCTMRKTAEIFASRDRLGRERSRDVTKQAKKDKYLKSWKVRVEL